MIVATTSILRDVTSELVGDGGEVSVLMPPGTDPHTFEASARQLARMQKADLIVANGANLEAHLQAALTEAEDAGVPVFYAIDHVDALTFDGHGDEHDSNAEHASESGHNHEKGSVDPHYWLDPTRMADAVGPLSERIAGLTDQPGTTGQRAHRYAGELEELDGEIAGMLAGIPDDKRTLITNHEAFNYFAEHYGFTIVGTVIPSLSTGAEPSAQDMQRLAETIEREGVRVVFAENTQPEQLAETLAQEVGADVQVVELYSDALGDEASDARTYPDMLRANAQLISDALRP